MKAPVSRWTEPQNPDVPAELRRALDTLRAESPSAAQLERMIAGVSLALEPAAVGPARAVTAARGVSLLKLSAMILALAGAVWLGLLRTPEPPRLVASAPGPAPTRPALALSPVAAPMIESPALNHVRPAKVHEPAAAPRARTERSVHKASATTAPALTRDTQNVSGEIALLRRAKRAIALEPRTALGILNEHRGQFAAPAFAEERDALEVEALRAAGQRDRADASERTFRDRYPNSAYLRRLDRVRATP